MQAIQAPVLEAENTTTKDRILSVLCTNWPLSAKKIHAALKRQGKAGITYQAIHKSLQALVSDKVLAKQGSEYMISLSWVGELKRFTSRVEQSYSSTGAALFGDIKNVEVSGDVSVLTFESVEAADKYIINFPRKTNKAAIGHARHFWWALLYLKGSFDSQTKHLLGKTYGLCRGATVLDRWCVNFENAIGMSAITGADCAKTCDIYVYDDYVIQVFMPLDIVEKIDNFYEETKDMFSVDFRKLISTVYGKKAEVTVVVKKDAAMADRLRKETLSSFKASVCRTGLPESQA